MKCIQPEKRISIRPACKFFTILVMPLLVHGCKLDPYEIGEGGGWNFPDAAIHDARPEADAEIDAEILYCDGADIMNDPYNCGECENVCEFPNAFASCVEGECVMGACLPGYHNLDENEPGCEYHCLITNNGVETCDGRDNNCNGLTDEGFDLLNDPRHCGACNKVCAYFKAVASCVEGECVLDYCHSGYVDKDGDPTNGCECMINAPEDPEGAECDPKDRDPCPEGEVCVDRLQDGVHRCSPVPPDLCNGIDTNCNGLTDEDAPEGDPCYTHPSGCSYDEGTDAWTCHGECTTGTRQCIGGMYQCLGQQSPNMEVCDGRDNNCNGLTDEDFDFINDPNNCGGCGQTCTVADVPNSVPGCVNGECVIMACLPGFHNLDENEPGCEYACAYTNGGVERCDGVDNNCNGLTDEGFDLENDPNHCGECNKRCEYPSGIAGCHEGDCFLAECLPGFHNLDENEPGCEYACNITNGGIEICDGRDNDCNGIADDGFDLLNDPYNCGECNRACSFPNAQAACVDENCVLDYCHSGYVNKDGNPANGCECVIKADEDPDGAICDPTELDPCPAGEVCVDTLDDGVHRCSPVPPDLCDGIDTNCNGLTDEDAPEGHPCYNFGSGCNYDEVTDTWNCHGECETGTMHCIGGEYYCFGGKGPSMEVCDGLDNNCNGLTDDGFDLVNDPNNCGECGKICTQDDVPNAIAGCEAGACIALACLPGFHNIDENEPGCEYACEYTNGGVERCDGVDNNCNGLTDEGFDLMNDPNHCGECNKRCQYPNAIAGCNEGTCFLAECLPGFHNINNEDDVSGCEYACTITNNGIEICDGRDNDCNGITDDGFDTSTDLLNCGNCGYVCADHVPAGTQVVSCTNAKCVYACLEGFYDLNGDLALGQAGDGCEYECTITNGGVEICDGLDNNCNGQIDRNEFGVPLTQPCYTGPENTQDVGICRGGTATCVSGDWGPCVGEIVPEAFERCDDIDHDCDGDPLNGFDLTTDILNCGGCGNSCFIAQPDKAYATGCFDSQCQYACDAGFHDLNNDLHEEPSDGCEYECWQTAPPGVEYCDGIDNNCDGDIDTAEYLVEPPPGYCRTDPGTPCEGTTWLCEDGILGKTWYCQYHPDVETDPLNPNRVRITETLCNEKDGNCSTIVDEPFLLKGQPCDDGKIGACLGTGHYVCDATQTGVICEITEPGAEPEPEICNGIDSDCNGIPDDNAWDTMVHVVVGDLNFWIDAYEASRPDATEDNPGVMDHRSCSNPNVIPWHLVTWDEAAAACAAGGKRLCTEEEWQAACEGPLAYVYPYGDIYEPEWCNSAEYNHNCAPPYTTGLLPTGAPHGCPPPPETFCISDHGAMDMSGNLMEWTGTQASASPLYYRIRGGSYNNIEPGLTCSFDFISAEPEFFYYDIGFRCCADHPPWED